MGSRWVVLCLVFSARFALAKPGPEVAGAKQLWAAQLAALNGSDTEAFAKTFDDATYVIFPSSAEATARDDISTNTASWVAYFGGKLKVTAKNVKFGSTGDSHCAWISADLLIKGPQAEESLRVTEFVAPKQNPMPETPVAADYRVLSAHFSTAVADKTAMAAAGKGELTKLAAVIGGHAAMDELSNPATLATYLTVSADPAVTLIGSAPGERFTGKATVASKLTAWKKLAIKSIDSVNLGDAVSMNAASSSIWHVEITFKSGGKDVVLPYRAHVITARKQLCAAHFSIAK